MAIADVDKLTKAIIVHDEAIHQQLSTNESNELSYRRMPACDARCKMHQTITLLKMLHNHEILQHARRSRHQH